MNTHSSTPDTPQAGRRSRLKTWGLAGALVLTLGVSACGHRHHHSHSGVSEERVTKMVDKVFSRVDATDAQKTQISSIANQAVTELKPMRQSIRQARGQALKLLSAEQIDRAAIDALRAEQMATADKASTVMSNALADIAEVLTPAQRLEVQDKLSARMKWHDAGTSSE
ncbi:MAG: Spy/CpxP family protein refolding chaperone [Burkholderiaceae bacterium]